MTTSLVLLLGCASVHILSLQGLLSVHSSVEREHVSDQLRSAAQAFISAAMSGRACLLLTPSAAWDLPQLDCPDAEPERLRSGRVRDQSWHLLDWQPRENSGVLRLALTEGPSGIFRVQLDSEVPRVLALSDPQLQGRHVSVALS